MSEKAGLDVTDLMDPPSERGAGQTERLRFDAFDDAVDYFDEVAEDAESGFLVERSCFVEGGIIRLTYHDAECCDSV